MLSWRTVRRAVREGKGRGGGDGSREVGEGEEWKATVTSSIIVKGTKKKSGIPQTFLNDEKIKILIKGQGIRKLADKNLVKTRHWVFYDKKTTTTRQSNTTKQYSATS